MSWGFLRRPALAPSFLTLLVLSACTIRPNPGAGGDLAAFIQANYDKEEVQIPMRDGVRLFTAIYTPKDRSRSYPFLMRRTPYSVAPYGERSFPEILGPSDVLTRGGFIFVLQDVRGAYMSEGDFVNMTPHLPLKSGPEDIDESTDAYDTIEWLLANVENHNGKVGMWGISYPGFYAAASMIDAHPALVAVSPQAPIADWWYDDFHHHGAFFLPHAFNFLSSFGVPRPEPTTQRNPSFDHGTPDGYSFFLGMGPLGNANELYLRHGIPFWDSIIAHPNYDGFWQPRNLLPHLGNVAPAVLTVGGWYDAEDLFGPLNIYRSVEEKNPDVFNALVMGPWRHGGWARDDGTFLGNAYFASETAPFYRENIEAAFFNHFLKDEGQMTLPEAYVFETGTNRWRTFPDWPPEETEEAFLYPGPGGSLAFAPVESAGGTRFDEWVSDPSKPVPYTADVAIGMTREYMTDDQRFASRRPDVQAYQTEVLREDVTLVGPLLAELWVSTSGTDSDWIVKLVDVFPPDAPDPPHAAFARGMRAGEAQMMVRSEVIRGRFRNSHELPEPFIPNQPTRVELPLQDVLHTFQAGHRIMIQVQSTWFPLVDRNPQTYVENIYLAEEGDFVAATQRLYRGGEFLSRLRVGVLPREGGG
ncbi:MAG: CocE/NonD family hydrolase [Longimicrobiales bacterium]